MTRGFTQTSLAKSLNISQGYLSKIELGLIADVNIEFINSISAELDFPKDFFFERIKILDPGIKYYRARKNETKKTLDVIDSEISIVVHGIKKLMSRIDFVANNIPEFNVEEFDNAEDCAKALRAYWKLPRGPIKDLSRLVEDNGGLVIKWNFLSNKIDGFTFIETGLPPVIFLNKNLTGDRYRFTLAHELGHLVMHSNKPYRPEQDIEADLFASEFMMPSNDIYQSLYGLNFEALAAHKAYWKMSMGSILYKAKHLDLLSENQYRYWMMKFSKFGYNKREPISTDIPLEEPSLFIEILKLYFDELDYSEDDLADVLRIGKYDFARWYLGTERKRLKLVK